MTWLDFSLYNWYVKTWYHYHSRTLNLKVSGLWLMTGFRERERKKNRKDSGYIEEIRHIIWKINGLTNRYRFLKNKKAILDLSICHWEKLEYLFFVKMKSLYRSSTVLRGRNLEISTILKYLLEILGVNFVLCYKIWHKFHLREIWALLYMHCNYRIFKCFISAR